MHQFECGVNEQLVVGEYRVEILEISAEEVCLGLSVDGTAGYVHRVSIPRNAESLQQCAARPIVPQQGR